MPIEDVAGAVKELMSAGKVLHWGQSEMGLNTLRRAHAALPVTAVQNEYSMLWRGPEKDVIPTREELGIGFVPWSPLSVQFLTGAIDANTRFAPGDIRGVESRFSPENLPHNLVLPWDEAPLTAACSCGILVHFSPYRSHVHPASVISALNHMIDHVNNGDRVFYEFYTEEQKKQEPMRSNTGLFFSARKTWSTIRRRIAGRGFSYVASVHEGLPYAVAIRGRGYNAFVLKYRVGSGGALATRDQRFAAIRDNRFAVAR